MRQWIAAPCTRELGLVSDLVGQLGSNGFAVALLRCMRNVLDTASVSVYRVGPRPVLYFSGSHGVPDRTRDCWRAYLSGPHHHDRTLSSSRANDAAGRPVICHTTTRDMSGAHRRLVYEAFGVVERVSVVQPVAVATRDAASLDALRTDLLAINFYRHEAHAAFSDEQLDGFARVAPTLLSLTRRHLEIAPQLELASAPPRERLRSICPQLTPRELDVCERIVRGMTHDGIAAELFLSLPTVKTYRNRAFARLGIRFRNELVALLVPGPAWRGPARAQ